MTTFFVQCYVGFCCITTRISHMICISLPSWTSLPFPHPSPPGHHRARRGSLCYTATSHQLSSSHAIVYISWCHFLHLSPSLPPPLGHKSILYICVSIPSLQVKWSEVAQSCPTLCDPVDCSPPGSSIHGILQARILEWVAISFSRGSSWPRDQTQVSCIAGKRFNLWATREAKPW